MTDILAKTRAALVTVITAANVGTTNIYNGKASADKQAPDVSCGADNAVEDPVGSGNFFVDAEVQVRTIAVVDSDGTDPATASDTIEAAVITALEDTTLAASLTAAVSDYTVFGFQDSKQVERTQDEDCWVLTWKRKIYCCCSAL